MPIPGIVTVKQYSSTEDLRLFSPAVWAYCPSDMDLDSQGIFVQTTFASQTVGLNTHIDTNGTSAISSYASTIIVPGDHVLALTSGSTANTATAAIVSCPLGSITPGGNGVWFETSVLPASSTAAQTAFFGLTISTGLYTSAFFSTQTKLPATLPLVGFYMTSTTPNNVSAVFQASSGGLSTVLANVLTSSTANPNPGSLTYSPFQAPGAFLSSTATAVKLGVEYNAGSNTINYFVNGYVAASFQPNSAIFDVTDSFGAIVAIGGVNQTLYVDFVAAAAQIAK